MDDDSCVICYNKPPTHAIIPCGHHSICDDCVSTCKKTLKICPICRSAITSINKIYKTNEKKNDYQMCAITLFTDAIKEGKNIFNRIINSNLDNDTKMLLIDDMIDKKIDFHVDLLNSFLLINVVLSIIEKMMSYIDIKCIVEFICSDRKQLLKHIIKQKYMINYISNNNDWNLIKEMINIDTNVINLINCPDILTKIYDEIFEKKIDNINELMTNRSKRSFFLKTMLSMQCIPVIDIANNINNIILDDKDKMIIDEIITSYSELIYLIDENVMIKYINNDHNVIDELIHYMNPSMKISDKINEKIVSIIANTKKSNDLSDSFFSNFIKHIHLVKLLSERIIKNNRDPFIFPAECISAMKQHNNAMINYITTRAENNALTNDVQYLIDNYITLHDIKKENNEKYITLLNHILITNNKHYFDELIDESIIVDFIQQCPKMSYIIFCHRLPTNMNYDMFISVLYESIDISFLGEYIKQILKYSAIVGQLWDFVEKICYKFSDSIENAKYVHEIMKNIVMNHAQYCIHGNDEKYNHYVCELKFYDCTQKINSQIYTNNSEILLTPKFIDVAILTKIITGCIINESLPKGFNYYLLFGLTYEVAFKYNKVYKNNIDKFTYNENFIKEFEEIYKYDFIEKITNMFIIFSDIDDTHDIFNKIMKQIIPNISDKQFELFSTMIVSIDKKINLSIPNQKNNFVEKRTEMLHRARMIADLDFERILSVIIKSCVHFNLKNDIISIAPNNIKDNTISICTHLCYINFDNCEKILKILKSTDMFTKFWKINIMGCLTTSPVNVKNNMLNIICDTDMHEYIMILQNEHKLFAKLNVLYMMLDKLLERKSTIREDYKTQIVAVCYYYLENCQKSQNIIDLFNYCITYDNIDSHEGYIKYVTEMNLSYEKCKKISDTYPTCINKIRTQYYKMWRK